MFAGCDTLSGTGTKYTSLQAAMILQKMKVVDFLLDQPSIDLTVKSTDGKNTIIVAVEAKVWRKWRAIRVSITMRLGGDPQRFLGRSILRRP